VYDDVHDLFAQLSHEEKKTMNKLLLAVASLMLSAQAFATSITGAGATFPAPVYSKWADEYKKQTGVQLNYQAIGSGGGIKQIDARTVDFGATDDPRKAEELTAQKQVQFATVKGGVVAVINLDGVTKNSLNLTAQQMANIFVGKYKTWREVDPKLPATPITRVVRADSSGTTAVFTGYLASKSSDFKNKIGAGKTVKWGEGQVVSGKGNAGVAAMVKQIKGSIGYVEYAYAKQGDLVTTRLNGAAGGLENFANGKYELTAATYVIFYREGANKEAVKFWEWALANGDKLAQDLDYVPLSAKEKAESAKILKSIK
jgi:phosphate transport system substrate-binding protein